MIKIHLPTPTDVGMQHALPLPTPTFLGGSVGTSRLAGAMGCYIVGRMGADLRAH